MTVPPRRIGISRGMPAGAATPPPQPLLRPPLRAEAIAATEYGASLLGSRGSLLGRLANGVEEVLVGACVLQLTQQQLQSGRRFQ